MVGNNEITVKYLILPSDLDSYLLVLMNRIS